MEILTQLGAYLEQVFVTQNVYLKLESEAKDMLNNSIPIHLTAVTIYFFQYILSQKLLIFQCINSTSSPYLVPVLRWSERCPD